MEQYEEKQRHIEENAQKSRNKFQRVNKGFDIADIEVNNSAVLLLDYIEGNIYTKPNFEFFYRWNAEPYFEDTPDYEKGMDFQYRKLVKKIDLTAIRHGKIYPIKNSDDFKKAFQTPKVYIFTTIWYNDMMYVEKYKKDIEGITILSSILKQIFRAEPIFKRQYNKYGWDILVVKIKEYTIYLMPIQEFMVDEKKINPEHVGDEWIIAVDPKFILAMVLKALGQKPPCIGAFPTNCVLEDDGFGGYNTVGQNICMVLFWMPYEFEHKNMKREYTKYLKYKEGIENAEE